MNLRIKKLSVLTLVLFGFGCKTPPAQAEGTIAWVEINSHTPLGLGLATKAVFSQHGYRLMEDHAVDFLLEERRTAWDDITQGEWDKGTSVRVNVFLWAQTGTHYVVHRRAALVRSAGDPILEEPHHLSRISGGPYQKPLDQ